MVQRRNSPRLNHMYNCFFLYINVMFVTFCNPRLKSSEILNCPKSPFCHGGVDVVDLLHDQRCPMNRRWCYNHTIIRVGLKGVDCDTRCVLRAKKALQSQGP